MDRESALSVLRARLDADLVSTDDHDLARHADDVLTLRRGRAAPLELPDHRPFAVVRPRSAEDVAVVLRTAAQCGFSVVPYGGGTGLMGGAVPLGDAISLHFGGMQGIRSVQPEDRLVWAEAGATLAQVDAALRPYGLMTGHDPWTFNIATVGGAIGTNGLGYVGGKYGGMGDQVVAVEAVLPDGRIMTTRAVPRHSAGLDLRRLFVGTEGTMGVVTAAALRAFPVPEMRIVRGYAFADFDAGLAAVNAMADIGLYPAMIDLGQSFRGGAGEPARLYLVFEGFREGAEAEALRGDRVCRQQGGSPMADGEAMEFWETRHAIADAFARRREEEQQEPVERSRWDFIHVALPASHVSLCWRAAKALCERRGVQLMEAGLWVRPELFSLALSAEDGSEELLPTVVDQLLRLVHQHGGSVEYCHGVGLRLAHLMAEEHGENGLAAMRAIKRALDPNGVLNPGKLGL